MTGKRKLWVGALATIGFLAFGAFVLPPKLLTGIAAVIAVPLLVQYLANVVLHTRISAMDAYDAMQIGFLFIVVAVMGLMALREQTGNAALLSLPVLVPVVFVSYAAAFNWALKLPLATASLIAAISAALCGLVLWGAGITPG